GDLRIAVQQLVFRAGEVEPLVGDVVLLARAIELRALDVERRVLEDGVLATVVEMQMRVDDDAHVGGAEVMLRQRVGHVAVDDLPLLHERLRIADAGVDKDRANARVLDDESMHRDVVERLDNRQVEADDLHCYGKKGETAKMPNSAAT